MRLLTVISLCICSLLGCSADDATESSNGTPDTDSCEPGCHYDCLGRAPLRCSDGLVYFSGTGPRPCCHYSDFDHLADPCALNWVPPYECGSKKCRVDAGMVMEWTPPSDLCEEPDAGDASADVGADAATDG